MPRKELIMSNRQAMIEKYYNGDEEAYREGMRAKGRKGGQLAAQRRPREDYPFARDPELARRAGKVGKDKRYKHV